MKFWKSAVVAAVASLTFGGVANAQNLRLLASWDSSYAAVSDVLMPFVQKLENDTTAGVKIQIMGPETVPPFEQLDPVARGLFDMLFTNGAYHFNDTAMGMSLDAMSGTAGDLRDGGVFEAVDKGYQEIGLKLVAVLFDLNGYHIMLKEPVGDNGLEGRRVRGTRPSRRLADLPWFCPVARFIPLWNAVSWMALPGPLSVPSPTNGMKSRIT